MKVTILTPAHNEENTIGRCILSVKNLDCPANIQLEHVIIADRCIDKTVEICQRHNVKVLIKDFRSACVSAITDALNFGVKNTTSDLIGKVDADVILPQEWLQVLLPHLDERTLSVASVTKASGRFMWLRNLNYRFSPFGRQPRGQARLINRKLLEEIGGFDRTAPNWDTPLDLKAHQYGLLSKSITQVTVTEKRDYTMLRLISHQLSGGRARRRLGLSLFRTILHSIFRGRFFVLLGYCLEASHLKKKIKHKSKRINFR